MRSTWIHLHKKLRFRDSSCNQQGQCAAVPQIRPFVTLHREKLFNIRDFLEVVVLLMAQSNLGPAVALNADEMMQILLQLPWVRREHRHSDDAGLEAGNDGHGEVQAGEEHQQSAVAGGDVVRGEQLGRQRRGGVVEALSCGHGG